MSIITIPVTCAKARIQQITAVLGEPYTHSPTLMEWVGIDRYIIVNLKTNLMTVYSESQITGQYFIDRILEVPVEVAAPSSYIKLARMIKTWGEAVVAEEHSIDRDTWADNFAIDMGIRL